MRDAFGGAFMFEVFIVFFMVYIVLIAVSVNYAKAFKVKDAIIDYIESNEITNIGNLNYEEDKIFGNYIETEILSKMNYNKSDIVKCSKSSVFCSNGVNIEKIDDESNAGGVYYKVTTYTGWNLSKLNILTALGGKNRTDEPFFGVFEINGYTRLIIRE